MEVIQISASLLGNRTDYFQLSDGVQWVWTGSFWRGMEDFRLSYHYHLDRLAGSLVSPWLCFLALNLEMGRRDIWLWIIDRLSSYCVVLFFRFHALGKKPLGRSEIHKHVSQL